MKGALQLHSRQFQLTEMDTYATAEDFQMLFAREMTNLFRLSLLLTADASQAEESLIRAIRECSANSAVSKEWALTWARRTVIRNAISVVVNKDDGTLTDTVSEGFADPPSSPSSFQMERMQDSLGILAFPIFERLVYVICVLERHSIMDCALLLSRSPKDVNEARNRAINRVASAASRGCDESARTPHTVTHRACCNRE